VICALTRYSTYTSIFSCYVDNCVSRWLITVAALSLQTLKNLYRLFEFKTEPHHTTVISIVKSIWPSYRIMRKQYEGRSKDSAVLIQ
jgi:hypothetical protein